MTLPVLVKPTGRVGRLLLAAVTRGSVVELVGPKVMHPQHGTGTVTHHDSKSAEIVSGEAPLPGRTDGVTRSNLDAVKAENLKPEQNMAYLVGRKEGRSHSAALADAKVSTGPMHSGTNKVRRGWLAEAAAKARADAAKATAKKQAVGGGTTLGLSNRAEAVELVGPKGYEHGWVFVGVPESHKSVLDAVLAAKKKAAGGQTHYVRLYKGSALVTPVPSRSGRHIAVVPSGKAEYPTVAKFMSAPKAPPHGAQMVKPTTVKPPEPAHVARLRAAGLEPITGHDDPELQPKLMEHLNAVDAANRALSYPGLKKADAKKAAALIGDIAEHHQAMGVPPTVVEAGAGAPASRNLYRARAATMLMRTRAANPTARGAPSIRVADLSNYGGSNAQTSEPGSVAAYYQPGANRITYDVSALMDTSRREKPTFSDTHLTSFPQAAMSHEYGHALDSSLSPAAREQMFREIAQAVPGANPTGTKTMGAGAWTDANTAPIVNHVGTYASANDKELVAELYAEFKHSKNPSPAANIVGKYLEGQQGAAGVAALANEVPCGPSSRGRVIELVGPRGPVVPSVSTQAEALAAFKLALRRSGLKLVGRRAS